MATRRRVLRKTRRPRLDLLALVDTTDPVDLADPVPGLDPDALAVITAATRRHAQLVAEDADAWGWAA